jgi:Glycosyltransferase (GlcNAc)
MDYLRWCRISHLSQWSNAYLTRSIFAHLSYHKIWDAQKLDIPRFAPVVGAGYVVADSSLLKQVPFDPFLPWIFMGEEIILSARLWTAGYDLFSPAQAVLGHIYNRPHTPKFWESVHRAFSPGVYHDIEVSTVQLL